MRDYCAYGLADAPLVEAERRFRRFSRVLVGTVRPDLLRRRGVTGVGACSEVAQRKAATCGAPREHGDARRGVPYGHALRARDGNHERALCSIGTIWAIGPLRLGPVGTLGHRAFHFGLYCNKKERLLKKTFENDHAAQMILWGACLRSTEAPGSQGSTSPTDPRLPWTRGSGSHGSQGPTWAIEPIWLRKRDLIRL